MSSICTPNRRTGTSSEVHYTMLFRGMQAFFESFFKKISPCAGFGPASRFRLPGFRPGAVPFEPARHALMTGLEPVRRSPGYFPPSKRVPYQLGLHELALPEGIEPSRRFRRLPLSGRMQYRSAKTARSLLGDLNPAFPA